MIETIVREYEEFEIELERDKIIANNFEKIEITRCEQHLND